MSFLPLISGAEAIGAFQQNGWRIDRHHGDHAIMVKSGVAPILSIPQHRELKKGLLSKLIKQSGLSVLEFKELL